MPTCSRPAPLPAGAVAIAIDCQSQVLDAADNSRSAGSLRAPTDAAAFASQAAEQDALLARAAEAHRAFFEQQGVTALLVPTMPREPTAMQEGEGGFLEAMANAFFTMHLCDRPGAPSVSLPTKVRCDSHLTAL